MTTTELIERLKYIQEHECVGPYKIPEPPRISIDEAHEKADELLLEFINDDEVTNIFNSIEKWYA